MKIAVILPAAGLGTRMGKGSAERAGTSRKQFMLLEGSPILIHTVRKFAASSRVSEIVVAVRAEDLDWVREVLSGEFAGPRVRVVEGGNSRQQSVENALATLAPDTGLVAVHDAVRPCLTEALINDVFGGLKFPISFFPTFLIPINALWWGLAVGAGTALVGSILPAWTACSVKVSEVFAKVD
jgi:2-C-methyl-D-erythritol 4-phosphate cytidylyltransferase